MNIKYRKKRFKRNITAFLDAPRTMGFGYDGSYSTVKVVK